MKRSNFFIWLGITLSLGIILGWLLNNKQPKLSLNNNGKIYEIIRYLENNYVDSVSFKQLEDLSIENLLSALDPHSTYLTKEDLIVNADPVLGQFEGIGIQFRMEKDTAIVVYVIPNGPSFKKGIMPGDKIIEVNGKSIAGQKLKDVEIVKMLKGPKGTKVTVGIKREGYKDILYYELIRDVIPLITVDAAFLISPNTGYIRINSFSTKTAQEFRTELSNLKKDHKIKNLILDLRDNGKKILESAVEVANVFLPKNSLIVYLEGKHRPRKDFYAWWDTLGNGLEIAVLVNQFTASASEIVAGALQDNDRAIIIGRRTFGKGLVQEQITLKDSTALRITVARYYTPSGRCIQRPYSEGYEKYFLDYYESILDTTSLYSLKQNIDTTKYYTVKGRVVHGNGGIIPDTIVIKDYDVPILTFSKTIGSKTFFDNLSYYIQHNRKKLLNLYPDEDYFAKHFKVTDNMMKNLLGDSYLFIGTPHRETFSKIIASYIARELYSPAAYLKVSSSIDQCILTALKYFNSI
ncbi:MAG: S41 family peptidase [Bacteroidales bacterium]|nr:S41 family peptidase [Bacteroidales bacterium]